ncbi:uncharacterized protein ASCRUDRAFT_79448 [Ascoidea rubescens DSM 1968]|uniref:Uncharacterized protein n=1 Tax=Ascoidea rubescens DSM 1968 TaxID=1344418 RepID=A0A1D2VMG8_9ASCO|nr:hypothetical protein ASCRUDRAFT_79448 [Ascoidea rubescens DSM 1968]ODV62799.1 hypothetical protein ASCRUDRAFT_79448 [Ascoidea rubescens DSM 1968]
MVIGNMASLKLYSSHTILNKNHSKHNQRTKVLIISSDLQHIQQNSLNTHTLDIRLFANSLTTKDVYLLESFPIPKTNIKTLSICLFDNFESNPSILPLNNLIELFT